MAKHRNRIELLDRRDEVRMCRKAVSQPGQSPRPVATLRLLPVFALDRAIGLEPLCSRRADRQDNPAQL
jgi:hypothetical protein